MWKRVESEQDLERLMDLFGSFHDGCLREMHIWTETYVDQDLCMACPDFLDVRARVLFQRQLRDPSAIEMLFEQVIGIHVSPAPVGVGPGIFDACLMRRDHTIYWADWPDWTPDSPDRDDVNWIAAKRVSWRDASVWMGDELRYGPQIPLPFGKGDERSHS